MSYHSTPESAILGQICEYLELRGIYFFRVNNVAVFDRKREIYRKPMRWQKRGVSDLVALKDGRAYFIEVKSQVGKLSPDQREFQRNVEANKCKYILARSVDDLVGIL